MARLAFLFSGQGAQVPGMGQSLVQSSEAAARVYAMADAIRPGTLNQCATADKETLSRTVNAQPCLYCVDLAAAQALVARGVEPACVAGFSLGEIPALAFAGMLTPEDGFRLVCVRAEAMQAAADAVETGMMAVVGMQNDAVEAVCKESGIYPVNYNCPGQLVVAGKKTNLAEAAERIKGQGGRALPLPVSGAFHTRYMHSARLAIEDHLTHCILNVPRVTVYANATGKPYEAPYGTCIAQQVETPVRWQTILEDMATQGIDTFIEVGIGKTLSGFVRKTLPGATALQVEDAQSLEDTVRAVSGGQPC